MTAPQRLPYHGPEWIERIRSGDARAFETLFRALAPGLVVLSARYVGSRQVAEELVQELFLDLWTQRAELRVEQALTAYLYAATRNRAINYAKRERRMVRWDAASDERPDRPDPAAPNESELLDALELQHAVETLPARCRLIFTLNRQQDMTYGEIATSLGLSIKTVETQMGRALKALRDRLRHLVE
jgi:RNA polymerase sigma-70 factor, ECF subfamily